MPKQLDTTLLVINVSPANVRCLFLPTQTILLNAVLREVNKAMLDNTPIVLVNSPDFSIADYLNETHSRITNALAQYDYTFSLYNESYGGSEQILKVCGTLCYPTQRIQLCGLFTDLGIRDTAVSLARLMPSSTIDVLREACASTSPHEETYDYFWNRFSESNIDVIPAPVTLPISVTDRPLRFVARARDHMGRNYGEPISL